MSNSAAIKSLPECTRLDRPPQRHSASRVGQNARLRVVRGAVVCLLGVVGCGGDDDDTLEVTTSTSSAVAAPTTTAEVPTTAAAAYDPLVDRSEVELVDEGYGWSEGPQWISDAGVLLFTDGNANAIYQVAAGDEITVFRQPSNNANGLAVDVEGRLMAAEQRTRGVTRTESDGTVTPIADSFEGLRLNQPNDIAARSDGTVYFTDPLYADYEAELDFRGVFRIAPDGTLTAERRGDTTEEPNGIVLSPDERLLYVSNYAADLVWIFDVAPDGSLSEARTFVTTGDGPDGMAVDAAGNLFVTDSKGIEVFAPDGSLWGAISVPRIPANCAFGGADGRTLYITARAGIYRVTLAHPGLY